MLGRLRLSKEVNVYPVQSLLEVRELLNSAAFGTMKAAPLK